MEKTRPFSIYLLKPEFDQENALATGHKLEAVKATELPEGASLYIMDADPKSPWWVDYFGVSKKIKQELKSAIIFLPVGKRWFVISFGQVVHHLNDYAYEYDFGLRVTLNSLDPKELKSADMVDPGNARRKRTQVPVSTELTYLDFDGNTEIIKGLTGKVKPEYKELFKNATGAAALKVGLKITPDKLPAICESLLDLFEKDDFKKSFPNIQNIVPVKDPSEAQKLNEILIHALREKDSSVTLTIPDIVDYRDNTCCVFIGNNGVSDVYPDISIEGLFEFWGDDFDYASLTMEELKSYRMLLTDADGNGQKSYGVHRSLIMDAKTSEDGVVFHLCDGNWYRVEKSYVERLKLYLDEKCEPTDLCAYSHDEIKNGVFVYSEGKYNADISVWNSKYICLDQTDISPSGTTEIEPCDIYCAKEDTTSKCGYRGWMYYIKISTRSSHLSHLFNQGLNAVELISQEQESKNKLHKLISDRLHGNDAHAYLNPISEREFRIVFGVITHKDASLKSDNLPLFSKISLMRGMQRLHLYRIPCALTFIPDGSSKKDGHPKYIDIIVEIFAGLGGKAEARPIDGQGLDVTVAIKGCPKAVRNGAIGTRYKIRVRKLKSGEFASFHNWPFEQV